MYETKPLTEIEPSCRLIVDELPPLGQQVWLISKFGTGYKGVYTPPDDYIVAWSPLPALTKEQKIRLREMGHG